MSDFDDLMAGGFCALRDSMDCPTLTANGKTVKLVSTSIAKSKELGESGYWLAFKAVCEMLRAEFQSLALKDRTPVVYKSADGKQTINAKVIVIDGEENDGDPCVRVTILQNPG